MTTKSELTDTQVKYLEFIARYIKENGYAPTLRDFLEGFNYTSTNGVQEMLDRLQQLGYIKRDPNKARTLVITKEWK